jgi:hypothetical protein
MGAAGYMPIQPVCFPFLPIQSDKGVRVFHACLTNSRYIYATDFFELG